MQTLEQKVTEGYLTMTNNELMFLLDTLDVDWEIVELFEGNIWINFKLDVDEVENDA